MTRRAPRAAAPPTPYVDGGFWLPLGTLVLTALALTTTSAHVLELPVKLRYDARFSTQVNGTLHHAFATVGAAYGLAAIAAAGVLAVRTRREREAGRWALTGAGLLVAWLASWAAIVAPVNAQIAAAQRAEPARVPRW